MPNPAFQLLLSHGAFLALPWEALLGWLSLVRCWDNPTAALKILKASFKDDDDFPHEMVNDTIWGNGHKSQLTRFSLDIGKNIRRTLQQECITQRDCEISTPCLLVL